MCLIKDFIYLQVSSKITYLQHIIILGAATFGPTNRISDKTLCMVGALGEEKKYMFYEVHNLYGLSQAEPTYRFVFRFIVVNFLS